MKHPTLAVILSGCGHMDGSEIHEATLSLLAIHKNNADYMCFAPDIIQTHVINHLTAEPVDEKRNVLTESARIARGKIKPLAEFSADTFDALIIPGGFGAAKNLSDYAFTGPECTVNDEVSRAILAMHATGKPVGALCIAPVILARLIPGAYLTIGGDPGTAGNVQAMGASHKNTTHCEICIDKENKLVTTPCYMLDSRVDQIAEGAEKLVKAVLEMI
ncbi:isoprenoid biosynthesis glyoxalase ElbB [Desulfosediminicola flagellatus]|uniref:isoprenoid biosynthesis glyoxalase ElbB n=1 Tax=Desulfosediminicola flagellatus TaxID=2569541 RepID=UPI001E5837F4|nr:isoprenoid biosynthesis glyoxalase ElbB [Desulfosediminicola flagellatus]